MMASDRVQYETSATKGAAAGRNRQRAVRWWLYVICLLVFAMVLVGGATRLTDSGLSITEWKPIHGVVPPLSAEDWNEEFEKYRQIPEYQQINRGMSLAEFQFIYWWEWAHRLLGRIIGVAFFLPMVFFWASGRLTPALKPRLVLLLFLGGLQGAVGWWMVASGLVERTDVSQYRLAVHLTLACIIFAYALWLARGLIPSQRSMEAGWLRGFAGVITMAILVQIFLGGLVAGLDAGLAFNDWPTMDGALVPSGLLLLEPLWLNFFENPKTVQFVHRLSGYIVVLLIALNWLWSWWTDALKGASVLLVLAIAQALIGIATLVMQVPLGWALAHQAGAIILLAAAVIHWRALSPRPVSRPA